MVRKEYNSPEYYAQTFRNFVIGDSYMFRKFGGTWHATHSLDMVHFDIYGLKCGVKFTLRNNVPYVALEIEVNNNEPLVAECKFVVIRSRTGRISAERSYSGFIEDFIIPNLKRALKRS